MEHLESEDGRVVIYLGRCEEVLQGMGVREIDSIISDPPYGIGFMGKGWDTALPGVESFRLLHRVLKRGGYFLCFGGTRTFHRLGCLIEDSGFEIRDVLCWLYGSGFPKGINISKDMSRRGYSPRYTDSWVGYGTGLKPCWEPIILSMKGLDGGYSENAMIEGVSGLNIDGTRIGYSEGEVDFGMKQRQRADCGEKGWSGNVASVGSEIQMYKDGGRWPGNVVLSHADGCKEIDGVMECVGDCPRYMLDGSNGLSESKRGGMGGDTGMFQGRKKIARGGHDDFGGVSRFFYCGKASRNERTCEGTIENNHPTVKPKELMRWLCRLTKTPYGGVVLDPYMGSGTTGLAAISEGREFIGIEMEEGSYEIARKRFEFAGVRFV